MYTGPLPDAITDLSRSAVIVVDVQNDFVHEDGRSGRGRDGNARYRTMVEQRLKPFIDEARASGAQIVWVRMENSPESVTEVNARIKRKIYGQGDDYDIWQRAVCVKGSWGAELYLKPQPGDAVVTKTRYSSFVRTDLDGLLQERGIETALISGVVTNQCVESTARDAYQYDYNVILLSDCVAELDETARDATFANIERSFGWVRTSAELLKAWEGHKIAVRR